MNKLFAGAGIIITTSETNQTKDESVIVVKTKYAKEVSTLLYLLKDYFEKEIDYLNKYEFYGGFAEKYNYLIEKYGDAEENMKRVLLLMCIRKYFAYGSNMDSSQMAKRCKGAIFVCNAVLKNQKFVLDSAGKASVIPDNNSYVEGTVWILNEDDEKRLDSYEGVPLYYSKKEMIVNCDDISKHMLVYTSNRDITNEAIDYEYIHKIFDAAIDKKLSDDYIETSIKPFVK